MTTEQKLEHFAVRELRKIMPNLIIKTDHNNHVVFGRYTLSKIPQGVAVYSHSGDLMAVFDSQRSAVSFCVADKFHNYNLAAQIKTLDTKAAHLANDIACRRGVAAQKKFQFQDLVETKLAPKLQRYQVVRRELEKCINLAKYLQLKGFQNETARVFPSQAH